MFFGGGVVWLAGYGCNAQEMMNPMIKLTVLYQKPADELAFEMFYNANLALMERIPNVIRREVSHVYGAPDGNPAYHRMLELYFDDNAQLDAAMRSEAGVNAGQHLMSQAAELVTLLFSEVYEEDGGATPNALPHDAGDAPSDPEDASQD